MSNLYRCVVSFAAAALLLMGASGIASAQLFVANFENDSVTAYDQGVGGNLVPVRTIKGAATGLNGPFGIAVDNVNRELFVTNESNNSITVYDLDAATGNALPKRTLIGAATGLDFPFAIAVDTVNNELFVANNDDPGSITVYSSTAMNNAAPKRTLAGAATGLLFPISVTLDSTHDELIVANNDGSTQSSITTYPRTWDSANTNIPPLRSIVGGNTHLINPNGVGLDLVNDELVVADSTSDILVFARTLNGNFAPLRTIAGVNTGLETGVGVVVDPLNNEITVASYHNDSIRTFDRTKNGDFAPLRIIAGAATGLDGPGYLGVATPTSGGDTLSALSPAHLWLGLKNGDDYPIAVDVRVELLKNNAPVSAGLTRCVTGTVRDPAKAKEVIVPFNAFAGVAVASGDVLTLRVLTRVGTNPNDTRCTGTLATHSSAVGLRLYYDGATTPSRFDATIDPDPSEDLFLRSDGSKCPAGGGESTGVTSRLLTTTSPGGSNPKCRDSGTIKFVTGNAFALIGTWSITLP